MPPHIVILIIQHVIGRIPVEEAIDVDLIHDSAFGPVGRGESRTQPEGCHILQPVHKSALAQHLAGIAADDLEMIAQSIPSHLHPGAVEIKDALRLLKIQLLAQVLAHQPHLIHIGFGCAHTECHHIPDLWLRGGDIVRTLIRKNRISVQCRDHLHHITGCPHGLAECFPVFLSVHFGFPLSKLEKEQRLSAVPFHWRRYSLMGCSKTIYVLCIGVLHNSTIA